MSDRPGHPDHGEADGKSVGVPARGDDGRPSSGRAPLPGASGMRVLHVDDDDALRETVSQYLGEHGIDVVDASTVAAASDRLGGEDRIDCVVTEHDLPDGGGTDVLETAHAARPAVPVVLFTSEESETVASDALEAGAVDYITKETCVETLDLLANRVENDISRYRIERHYRLLVEANVVGVYSIRDRQFEYVNPRLADVLGYEQSGLIGVPVETVVPSDEWSAVERAIEERESGRQRMLEYTMELLRSDGERVPVEVRGARVESAGTESPLILGTLRNITERVRNERAAHESRDRMAALHAAAADVAAADSVGAVADRVLAAVDEVLDMDCSAVDVVEDDQLLAVAVSDSVERDGYHGEVAVDDESTLVAETYRTGESYLVDDLRETAYDSAAEEYRSAISVALGEQGVFQAAAREPEVFDDDDLQAVELLAAHAATALDRLDSRTRLEEQKRRLKEQNERLETFASVVSHDLRNPIEVARGHLLTGDVEGAAVEGTVEALDRMEQIMDDVLKLAQGDDGVESTTSVSVEATTRDAWKGVSTDDASLSVEGDAHIEADRSQLARLLENILSNAVEHGGEAVAVRVDVLGDDAVEGFYVADDGEGVPEGRRTAAFEAGVSGDATGSGLGLAIVKTIADAHGWTVDLVESADGGARFEIRGVEPAG